MTAIEGRFPLGAAITLDQLDTDPYPALARLRDHEPVSWVPVLDGWLVTRRDLCIEVMRDAARFTVDDPRFSTAQVVGPSMLSLDGDEHRRHRDPFAWGLRRPEVATATPTPSSSRHGGSSKPWRRTAGPRSGATSPGRSAVNVVAGASGSRIRNPPCCSAGTTRS